MPLTQEQFSEAMGMLLSSPEHIKTLKAHLAAYDHEGQLAPGDKRVIDEEAAKADQIETFKQAGLSENSAKFAAGLKLPGSTPPDKSKLSPLDRITAGLK